MQGEQCKRLRRRCASNVLSDGTQSKIDHRLLIISQLSQLHVRTGLEFLLIACRSDTKDFAKPFVYYSSEVVKQFITDLLNWSMDDLAIQLEAYVMSGLKGMCKCVTTVHSLTLFSLQALS